ncbi:phage major capsid protein [Auraticoccus monumenti]|uniref:Phage major capsid protein, HK97 family n=1 Tax=Auraticoccus monumenti TaxID=675864 RepID=A0A1G7D256_9ACTN|nr:phage major capsid protein [Auraticoccus monumenti]SDE45609.1 phage major capsid protein, HK97 family [Auraticoccus monumenti]
MAMNTETGSALLRPEQVHDLIIKPLQQESAALQTATVVVTDSKDIRIPIWNADPSAAWVQEGQQIPMSDADVDELVVIPSKLAGLSKISREVAEDSSPEASEQVGLGLRGDLQVKLDAAYFGNLAAPASEGLGSLTDEVTTVTGAFTNLDMFAEAAAGVEALGTTVDTWVARPTPPWPSVGSRRPTDPTSRCSPSTPPSPAQPSRIIEGRPLRVTAAVAPGLVWAILRARVHVVTRRDAEVTVDRSWFFTSDSVAVRATMRVGFGFAHPEAVALVTPGQGLSSRMRAGPLLR